MIDLDNKVYTDNINSLELDFINYSKESCPFISFLKIEIEDEIGSYKGVLKDYFDDLGINKNNFFTDVSNYISYELDSQQIAMMPTKLMIDCC